MPNWIIHNIWAKKAGIDLSIANMVNRVIDYGLNWALNDISSENQKDNDPIILKQLRFFHKKDKEKKYTEENLYVKAFYLHHLLDFFRETRVNIYEIELVFQMFLEEKISGFIEMLDIEGKILNFDKEINELFQLLRENKKELYSDLKGKYLLDLEK